MAQATDYSVGNATGAVVRTDMNSIFAAIISSNSGATEPTYKVEGTPWFNTATNQLKFYQNASWKTMFDFSVGTSIVGLNEIQVADGAQNDPSFTFTNYQTSGFYTTSGDVITTVNGTKRFTVGDVISYDEQGIVHRVVEYVPNQDAIYSVAATSNWTGAPTNSGTYGMQHRYKYDSGGSSRITVDTAISGVATEVWSLDNSGNMVVAKDLTVDRVLAVPIGVESTPEFSFLGDDNTGMTRASSNTIAFTCGGVSRSYINTTSVGPVSDNAMALGGGSSRWSVVYSATGTINTSDATQKTDVKKLTAKEKRVAERCKKLVRTYRWIEAVDEKGDDARYHFGMMAQDVITAFEAEGLDPFRYGVVCKDELVSIEGGNAFESEESAMEDLLYHRSINRRNNAKTKTGHRVVTEEDHQLEDKADRANPPEVEFIKEDRYGLRYDELAVFIIAAL